MTHGFEEALPRGKTVEHPADCVALGRPSRRPMPLRCGSYLLMWRCAPTLLCNPGAALTDDSP